jgi:DNA-binding NarL/FixJ family response regulator
MKRIHLLLVDDQALFIQSLKRVIESTSDGVVIDAVALNGKDAISALERWSSDVVLMDVRMPVMDGVEATKIIRQQFPNTQVIMLTTYDDDEYIEAALRAGAVGYLLKDIPLEQLISAVSAVGKGAFLISPSIAERLVGQATGRHFKQQADRAMPLWLAEMSKREREILYFIANGLSNQEIANQLFIAEQTVKNHVSVIYSKIGENDRFRVIEKIKECLENGYLLPPSVR